MCGPDEIISKKEVKHEGANRLYNDRDDQEESTICKYCEQLVANSACISSPTLQYFDHCPSILSFRQSSECCPLCRQLLEWIDKDTFSDCKKLENHGARTTIRLVRHEELGAADAQSFHGVSYWIFSLSTTKKFPMKRETWGPTLKHSDSASIHFVVAHDRG